MMDIGPTATAPAPVPPPRPGHRVEQIVARFARVAPPYAKGAHLYRDLGVASIEALSLLLCLEAELGVRLDDQRFIQSVTFEALSALVGEAR